MTDKEEQIAFKQYLKDWGSQYPKMTKKTMFTVYRSMDEANRLEFLEEAKAEQKEHEQFMFDKQFANPNE